MTVVFNTDRLQRRINKT